MLAVLEAVFTRRAIHTLRHRIHTSRVQMCLHPHWHQHMQHREATLAFIHTCCFSASPEHSQPASIIAAPNHIAVGISCQDTHRAGESPLNKHLHAQWGKPQQADSTCVQKSCAGV